MSDALTSNPRHSAKLALLWRESPQTPGQIVWAHRLRSLFEALATLSIQAEPVTFTEERADEVRQQLLGFEGVLVWVDPISEGRDRRVLDAMLRDVASKGTWISTHPDVILKMGTKEVLYRTKHLGWGTDTRLIGTPSAFRDQFPMTLSALGPRVLKQNRGNGGEGIWKVELLSRSDHEGAIARVLHARRGSVPEIMPLSDFMRQCESYFEAGGCIVDQPYQTRLPEGMIRCYMGANKVLGFGHQFVGALISPPPDRPDATAVEPGRRVMYPASARRFQGLRSRMESEWMPQMSQALDIDENSLPIIWDADFLYGPRAASGEDTYVLCEINVSSVYPFPEQATVEIARSASIRLQASTKARTLD